jgi:hypothetical protein
MRLSQPAAGFINRGSGLREVGRWSIWAGEKEMKKEGPRRRCSLRTRKYNKESEAREVL